MINNDNEAAFCRAHLIKCFIHPAIAALFTSWSQVNSYLSGIPLSQIFTSNEDLLTQFNQLKENPYLAGVIEILNNYS